MPISPSRFGDDQECDMREETAFTVHSSVLKIWGLLADLPGYARWHPHYRFSHGPVRGRDFLLSWLLFDDRRAKVMLYISAADKPRVLGWSAGRRWMFKLQERYEITPIANGAEVRHSFECGGLFAIFGWLAGIMTRDAVRTNMAAQDEAFIAQLKKQARKPVSSRSSVPRRPAPPPTRKADND